ncbi:MAG: APC family permease [Candidatus Bathyarchaeia archaeon]|jgi:amino acid transporter
MSKPTVFVRQATGLVKSVSPWALFFAMLGEIGFGTGLLLVNVANSFFSDGNPGGNGVDATLLLLFFVIFESFIFYHVVRSVGRTGGDYVWMSRNIGPVLGGALILGFVFTGMPFLAVSANWFVTFSLAPSISTIAAVSGNSGLTSFSAMLTTSTALIVMGLSLIAVLTAVDIVSPRSGFQLLAALTIIPLIGTFIMAGVFLGFGPAGIQASVSNFLSQNGGSYTQIASQYVGPGASLSGVVLLIPWLFFTLPWVNNAAAFSGELKNLKRSAWIGTALPGVFSGLMLAGFIALFNWGLGFNFAMQAPISWPGSLYAMGVVPNMLTIATIAIRDNPTLMWVMNVTFAVWYLASLQQTILSVSRYILGMSFDRLIPVQLAHVSDRFHSPTAALLLCFVVAIPMVFIVSLTNWTSLYTTSALGSVFFAFIGITAIIYGWRKRKQLGGTGPALIVSGLLIAPFFLYVTYQFLALPFYGINNISWGIMLFFWVLGALLYPIGKWYYGRKGLDLSLVFKELPPE